MVVGTIILLQDPLSPRALEQLLNLQPKTVRETLVHLHSVVIVLEDDVQVIPITSSVILRLYDRSYMVSECEIFGESRGTAHITRSCMSRHYEGSSMRYMWNHKSILLNSEVDGLSTRITSHISPHLQYACRHWVTHLASASVSDTLLDLIKEFCSKYLLYWVEVCSLLGELRSALWLYTLRSKYSL